MHLNYLCSERTMAGQLRFTLWLSVLIFASIFCADAHDRSGSIRIDCGATVDYTDGETGMYYHTDQEFIDSGVNVQLSSNVSTRSVQLKDLRSFPEGIKNCYTLTPEKGKDNRYALRALFLYGDYDGKHHAPTFDMYIGINKWATVNPDEDETYDDWWDIILVLPTNYITVCLLNTGSGVPFISSLELRPMPYAIYDAGPSMALDAHRRYDVGHLTSNLVRYEGDPYDRLWRELLIEYMDCVGGCVNITTASTIDVLKSSNLYKPPPELLRTAARALNKTFQLGFYKGVPNYISRTSPMYVYFHFAEIEKLKLGQKRTMFISSGGNILHDPFTLEYLVPQTIGPILVPIVEGEIQFSIESTNQSGIPPIVNGIEIFRVMELTQGVITDSQDVDAIMDIKETYNLTRNWRGDPCVNSSWDGVSCSSSEVPRIITLNLNSSGLTGGIAKSISNLTAIQYIDLSNNILTGPIPEFLTRLSALKFLNLAGNNLTGSVPRVLLEKSISGALILRLDNNTNLCPLESCEKKIKKWPIIPVVISASVFIVLVVAIAIWGILKFKGKKTVDAFKSNNLQFSDSEIAVITENFIIILGEGGFGKVYLGTLANGHKVAVKLLSADSKQGVREFSQEVELLMRVHHGNVVSLVGYCSDPKNMALVYEYMPNGNLKHHLSGDNEGVALSWEERIQIAVHSAQGLDYLHNNCNPQIIHCDLKTSNILLDENKQAKLADFGLSKAFKCENATHITVTTGAGTPGYIDPVLCKGTPKFTKSNDIYSLGVILLELVTGKPALVGGLNGISLVDWVLERYNNGDVHIIVDERLQGKYSIDGAQNLLKIAISCLNSLPNKRPGINEVLTELKQCMAKKNNYSGTTIASNPKYNSVASSSLMSYEGDTTLPSAR